MNHENITNIDDYRNKKSTEHDSAEEEKILATLESNHPAGKQWAKEKLLERPETMAKYIAGKLQQNGYPDDVVNSVHGLLEQIKAEEKYRPSEIAEGLYMEYAGLLRVTHEENERRSAEAVRANKQAKVARSAFKVIRNRGEEE